VFVPGQNLRGSVGAAPRPLLDGDGFAYGLNVTALNNKTDMMRRDTALIRQVRIILVAHGTGDARQAFHGPPYSFKNGQGGQGRADGLAPTQSGVFFHGRSRRGRFRIDYRLPASCGGGDVFDFSGRSPYIARLLRRDGDRDFSANRDIHVFRQQPAALGIIRDHPSGDGGTGLADDARRRR
jgi:hypothetical protein